MNEENELEQAEKANRLYWGSDTSVNRIADDMGLSKGSLYELVEPLPAGLPCPGCGEEMAYPNRTARERDVVTCVLCGREEDASRVPPGPTRPAADPVTEPEYTRQVVFGSALLGLAAGIAIGTILKRD